MELIIAVLAFFSLLIGLTFLADIGYIVVSAIVRNRRERIARQARIEMYKQMSQEYQRTGRRTW